MAASVSIKISPGELIDKITILEIKLERIKESGKLENVEREHEILTASRAATTEGPPAPRRQRRQGRPGAPA